MYKKMNIEIDNIKDSGNFDKERTLFKVTQVCNLGKYLIAKSQELTDDSFSSKLQDIYWFPDQDLKIGDLVVLYTKTGVNGNIKNDDCSNTYFYYWGLNSPLSDINKSCVVLLEASWKVKSVPYKKTEV